MSRSYCRRWIYCCDWSLLKTVKEAEGGFEKEKSGSEPWLLRMKGRLWSWLQCQKLFLRRRLLRRRRLKNHEKTASKAERLSEKHFFYWSWHCQCNFSWFPFWYRQCTDSVQKWWREASDIRWQAKMNDRMTRNRRDTQYKTQGNNLKNL